MLKIQTKHVYNLYNTNKTCIFAKCLIKTLIKQGTKILIKTRIKQIKQTKRMIMQKTQLKTKYQKEKEARELAIYNDYNRLIAEPGAMATAVTEYLMKRYNLHARSSIWQARQRTAKKLTKNENISIINK